METLVLRLAPGDDLRAALDAAFASAAREQGMQAACVISAVGSFTQAVLRYAAEPAGTPLAGPLELVTLSGTLSRDGSHLHASVSDAQGQVKGGHVMPGCVVRTTAEVVVGLLGGVGVLAGGGCRDRLQGVARAEGGSWIGPAPDLIRGPG